MRGKRITVNQARDGTPLLTWRLSAHGERAVLAVLRAKAPRRALDQAEAAQVAEWQATALLELAGLNRPPTPASLIAELPRVLVRTDVNLPVSGCTSWQAGRWLIVLNGSEPLVRQRFSLAHEYKHTIDHRYRDELYVDRAGLSAYAQAELAADYFAASLLMPRRWVYRTWADGKQRVSELARLFAVSTPAMRRRLWHLGLQPGPDGTDPTVATIYQRRKPALRGRP